MGLRILQVNCQGSYSVTGDSVMYEGEWCEGGVVAGAVFERGLCCGSAW